MKKVFLFVLMFAFAALTLSAGESTVRPDVKRDLWSPFQIVFLPGVPAYAKNTSVNGLKLGIPATGGYGCIRGVEASFLYSGTSFDSKDSCVDGIQASWFGPSLAEDVNGVQATMSYAYAERLVGFQAAGFALLGSPSSGCQAGIGAAAKSDFTGFQTGAATVTAGDFVGFQFGAVNVASQLMDGVQVGACGIAGKADGVQINLFNYASDDSKTFQAGIVNISKGKCAQLGAINIIFGSYLPVMVVCNCLF